MATEFWQSEKARFRDPVRLIAQPYGTAKPKHFRF